jgi:micrococcal nuclease
MKKKFLLALILIPGVFLFANNVSSIDGLAERLKGRILLQVEQNGEAWYVYPDDLKRYYLGRPLDAWNIMRYLGLGITNSDLARIPTKEDNWDGEAGLINRVKGLILLQVEEHGEAWYVSPVNGKRYYMGRPYDAFIIMTFLGLGITTADLSNITVDTIFEVTEGTFRVDRVIDGDTIDVDINGSITRLRLIGIDAPESVDPNEPVQCYAVEASNKAKELLEEKNVRIESDPTQGYIDVYHRLLRHVFLEDGTNFNEYMIKNGYAYEYTYSTAYKYQEEFRLAEVNARENKRGLWADDACGDVSKTTCDCSSNKYNCSDFTTHKDAQSLFECCLDKVGYDVHRLDADNDGLACEALP